MNTRRTFIIHTALAATALASATAMAAAPAAAPAPANMLLETDPTAVALGYGADSAKIDAKKFPKHAKEQACANCALFQGKAGQDNGPCPIFAGKAVSAKGWCSAYAKKA